MRKRQSRESERKAVKNAREMESATDGQTERYIGRYRQS